MAATFADVLVLVHHDDEKTVYRDVSYCPWRGGGGVTVYQDGKEIRHDDVLMVRTEPLVDV